MISFKQYCKEKFQMKQNIKDILQELNHEDYYLDVNATLNQKGVIYLKWSSERAPIQIFEFRILFEERFSKTHILKTDATVDDIYYYIIKRDE